MSESPNVTTPNFFRDDSATPTVGGGRYRRIDVRGRHRRSPVLFILFIIYKNLPHHNLTGKISVYLSKRNEPVGCRRGHEGRAYMLVLQGDGRTGWDAEVGKEAMAIYLLVHAT